MFSFLDYRYFVIPTLLAERLSKILLNAHLLCPRPQSGQQQVPPPAVMRGYVLEDLRTLRLFPDVSACGDASHVPPQAPKYTTGIEWTNGTVRYVPTTCATPLPLRDLFKGRNSTSILRPLSRMRSL